MNVTKTQFTYLVGAIKAAYPQSKAFTKQEDIELWYQMLKDYTYEDLSRSFYEHIKTNKFAPSISEIIERIVVVSKDKDIDRLIQNKIRMDLQNAIKRVNQLTEKGGKQIDEMERTAI